MGLNAKLPLNITSEELKDYELSAQELGLTRNTFCRFAMNGLCMYLKMVGFDKAFINRDRIIFSDTDIKELISWSKKRK